MKKLLLQVTLAVVLALGFNITANANIPIDMGPMEVDGMNEFTKATKAIGAAQMVVEVVLDKGQQALGKIKGSDTVDKVMSAEDTMLSEKEANARQANTILQKATDLDEDADVARSGGEVNSGGQTLISKIFMHVRQMAPMVFSAIFIVLAIF